MTEMPDWMQDTPDEDDIGEGADWFNWGLLGPEDRVDFALISKVIPGPEHEADTHPDATSDYSLLEFEAEITGFTGDADLVRETKTFPITSAGLAAQIKALWSLFQAPCQASIRVESYDAENDRPSSYQLLVEDQDGDGFLSSEDLDDD